MTRTCNPNHEKATNPDYECNTRTGRWNKKRIHKVKQVVAAATKSKTPIVVAQKIATTIATTPAPVGRRCNPNHASAHNPAYECNPLTGRWRKKRVNKVVQVVAAPAKSKTPIVVAQKIATTRAATPAPVGRRCNPNHVFAHNPAYECNPLTGRWRKKRVQKREENLPPHIRTLLEMYPSLRNVENIANYTLYDAIRLVQRELNKQKREQKQPQHKTPAVKTATKTVVKTAAKQVSWEEECKDMETSCPMDCDLVGTPWCELKRPDVFYFKEGGQSYCYGIEEIFNIIHTGFTALDTSYQVPPMRLQLPRDSFNRNPFSRAFFDAFMAKIKPTKYIPKKFPEVAYFLANYQRFYDDPAIQPFLRDQNSNKVQMSKAIEAFLRYDRKLESFQRDKVMEWKFVPHRKPGSIKKYIHHM